LEAQPPSASPGALSQAMSDRPAVTEDHGDRIKVVSSPALERLLMAAPVAVGVALVLGIVVGQFSLDDPMYLSGLFAVLAALVVFQGFARRIPDSFERLQTREVVRPIDLAKFADFKRGTTRLLNHPIGIVFGAIFVVFALLRFLVVGVMDLFTGPEARSFDAYWPLLLTMLAEALLGLALGLVLWRMLVVAIKVRELGDHFDLRVQLNHPDRCGGFRPLGDLCLWNALLVTVPAIFLGVWVVLAPTFPRYGTTYVELHSAFLVILAVLAPVTFLWPLWSIHAEMLRESTRLRAEVDQAGQQIDRLSRELLERSSEMSADEAAAIAHDLEIRQENYKLTERIPTWPIDLNLALKFGTSQVIPLLGLTGLSSPIVDAIDRFGGFLSSSS
jgi:hypothetical protein